MQDENTTEIHSLVRSIVTDEDIKPKHNEVASGYGDNGEGSENDF